MSFSIFALREKTVQAAKLDQIIWANLSVCRGRYGTSRENIVYGE